MVRIAFFSGKKGVFVTFRSSHVYPIQTSATLPITFVAATFLGAVTLLSWLAGSANAQDSMKQFSAAEHGLTFSYPTTLEPVTVDLPQSVSALRGRETGFPSFNVLVSADTYQPEKISENDYREKILNDYRAVGLTDAKVVRSYSSPIDGTMVYTAELRYQNNGQVLLAAVTLLPAGQHKHFILTYIDLGEDFYRKKRAREEIINSLRRAVADMAIGGSGYTAAGISSYWLAFTLFAALGLIAIFLLFKARDSSRTP